MSQFSEYYEEVLQSIKKKENVVLLGPGGSGKSYLINQLSDFLQGYDIYHEFNPNIFKSNYFVLCVNSNEEIKDLKTSFKLFNLL